MSGLNPPPPGPDEPPPPYVESETPSRIQPLPSHSNNTSSSRPGNTAQPQQRFREQHQQRLPQLQTQTQAQQPQHEASPASATPTSSAQYFASRPSRSSHIFTYPLIVRPNSLRSDYAYPRDWAPARDVSVQDWATFIGFLIPDEAVVPDAKGLSSERRRNVEGLIREWNDGFFLSRGVKLYLDDGMGEPRSSGEGSGRASGSWDTSSFASLPSSTGSAPLGPSPPCTASSYAPPVSSASMHYAPTTQQYRPPQSSKERLTRKLKGVAAEKDVSFSADSIRVGDKFCLTPGRLKIGKFNLDERGMNYGGKAIGPQAAPAVSTYPGAPMQPSYGRAPAGGYVTRPYGNPGYGAAPYPAGGSPVTRYGPPPMQNGPPNSYQNMLGRDQRPAPGAPHAYPPQQTGTM